jgi:hypothetical protein
VNLVHHPAFWLLALCSGAFAVQAELTVVPDAEPQRLFAGERCKVAVVLHNSGQAAFAGAITAQVFQVTSATAARLHGSPGKALHVLPGQTVVESVSLWLPEVMAETGFLIRWLENTQRVCGTTSVRVFPTNLLASLRPLAGEAPPGVFDPTDQLKPLLRPLDVPFQDLAEDGTDKFTGRLAIFGPFESKQQMRASLANDIRALAKRGVAVVWLQAPPGPHDPLRPSFYTVRVSGGTVVVAQARLVARLAENPEAQLNLLRLAELALRPAPFDLPDPETSN